MNRKKYLYLLSVIFFGVLVFADHTFDPKHPKYHRYELNFKLWQGSDVDLIFRTLLRDNRNFAPYVKKVSKVTHNGRSDLKKLGQVIHKIDYGKRTLKNLTTAKHLLHPGMVTFRFYKKRGVVYVNILGEGTGDYRWLNKKLANSLWKQVVAGQKEYLRKYLK